MNFSITGRVKNTFLATAFLLAGLGLYIFILANRTIPALRTAGVFVRYNFTLLVPLLLLLFWLALLPTSRIGRTVGWLVVLWAFGFSLAGLWASGQSETGAVSGLLPWTDASTYYQDSLRLLQGLQFSRFSAWRPIFPSLLSVLLGLAGYSLQAVLGALVFLVAISAYLLGEQVRRSHGALSASAVLVLLLLYFRRFSGTTMSENIGLHFGCLGTALLWDAASRRSRFTALAGLFCLSLALNTRPGPFFLLVFALWWGARFFRSSRFLSWQFAVLGILAIFAAFAVNSALQAQVTSETTVPFGNFTNALYGVVSGGEGWTHLYTQYPELASMPDPQRTLTSLELIRQRFLQAPADTLTGIIYNYSLLFSRTYYNLFSFARGENAAVAEIVRLSLYALSALGLLSGLLLRADPHRRLVSLVALGILLSVPLVPPGDAYGLRLYAAGIPIIVLLPVLGTGWLPGRLRYSKPASLFATGTTRPIAALLLAALLSAVSLAAPFAIRQLDQSVTTSPPVCASGQQGVVFRFVPGTFVRIIREDAWQLDWMPYFHRGRFVRQVHNLPNIEAIEEFEAIEGEFTLLNTIDLATGAGLLVVSPTPLLPAPAGLVQACGAYSSNPLVRGFHFFYLESAATP